MKETTKRKTTTLERTVFDFLNKLRESGVTNMYGAVPYIQSNFGISNKEASDLLSLWMENFNEEGEYESIKE